jgi:hypothetical protein
MVEAAYRIFLSCGSSDTPAQETFVTAVEAHLRAHGCEAQTVGRSLYSARPAVQAARDCIGACDGALVIAFERTRIVEGVERPESKSPTQVRGESHPTVWNHMEAAMAYAQRVPILTLVQPGLKRQGMLSTRFEWVALERELEPALLTTEEFRQVFAEWLSFVRATRGSRPAGEIDPASLKIGYLFSQLSVKQLIGMAAGIIALLTAVATASYHAGEWYRDRPPHIAATP